MKKQNIIVYLSGVVLLINTLFSYANTGPLYLRYTLPQANNTLNCPDSSSFQIVFKALDDYNAYLCPNSQNFLPSTPQFLTDVTGTGITWSAVLPNQRNSFPASAADLNQAQPTNLNTDSQNITLQYSNPNKPAATVTYLTPVGGTVSRGAIPNTKFTLTKCVPDPTDPNYATGAAIKTIVCTYEPS